MTFTRVARTVRSDTAEVFVGWNLVEEVRKHWGITYAAGRYFNCAYLQCFFIDPYVYLTPKATFGTTMFARIP